MKQILSTERLHICKAQISDAEFFLVLLNSPNWILHIGDRGIKDVEAAKNYIRTSLIKSYSDNGYGLYVMWLIESNTPIGISGFVKRPYLDNADIGFAILPEYEGKGLSFEAADALMDYGSEILMLDEILAITTVDNSRSQKLLIQIGLRENGTIKPDPSSKPLLLFTNK